MNTDHLEEFLTFAAELNYSTAAKKLYITRPTLSDHIRELEEELGCELVRRSHGKASLTPEGRRFIQTGANLLESWRKIKSEYSDMAENLLTVTIAQTNLPWLESLLYNGRHAVQVRTPTKRIEIETVTGPFSTVDALLSGANDIVVAGCKSYLSGSEWLESMDGVQGFKLVTEEIKLLMTQDNPLFCKPVIYARDLDGLSLMLPPDIYQSYLRDKVVDRFAEHGSTITLRTMDFTDHFEYCAYDFQAMFGIVPTTLIPRFGIENRDECRAFSLFDLPLETDFYALYSDDFAESENGTLLVEEMKRLVDHDKGQGL